MLYWLFKFTELQLTKALYSYSHTVKKIKINNAAIYILLQ